MAKMAMCPLITGPQPLNLPDGNRVHFEPIDCLIRFGKRWRGAACEALVAFGLEPPGLDGDKLGPRPRTSRGSLLPPNGCAATATGANVGFCASRSNCGEGRWMLS